MKWVLRAHWQLAGMPRQSATAVVEADDIDEVMDKAPDDFIPDEGTKDIVRIDLSIQQMGTD